MFLLHFPSARAAQALPGTLPDGVRTFLYETSPQRLPGPLNVLILAEKSRTNSAAALRAGILMPDVTQQLPDRPNLLIAAEARRIGPPEPGRGFAVAAEGSM